MSELIKVALEQNEKMYQEVKRYRVENEMLIKEITELKEKVVNLESNYNDFNAINKELKGMKSDLRYLADNQRSRSFDYGVGY